MYNKEKAAIVTLGCSKNEVDSEMILSYLSNIGYEITNKADEADCIVVNTCGFIKSAKEEAISVILDMIDYKLQGKCKTLVVTGCLAKRYKDEIIKNFPEVDLVIGVDEYKDFDSIFSNFFKLKCKGNKLEFKERIISTKFPTAYVRIADGCNNNCHYCAIPLIRGSLKSRSIEDIYSEVQWLSKEGIKEINIIAQDTTSYGIDLYGKPMLKELLHELSKIQGIKWFRVLYMYPGKISDDLIQEIKHNDRICKYFDIPIQHISDNILKGMNRHTNKKEIYDLINKIKKEIPEAVIRTTVMVGYQNETLEDFTELIDCMNSLEFDRLGAFKFSKEDDTVAEKMLGDINEREKNRRYNLVMRTQQEIIQEKMKNNLGKVLEVLVADISKDEKFFECRSYMDAPDVDPKILLPIKYAPFVIVGGFCKVKLLGIKGYDYTCEYIDVED